MRDTLYFNKTNYNILELSFETKLLRQLCEKEVKAKMKFGEIQAGKLKRRLADLHASENVNDLIVGNPRILAGSDNQQYILDIDSEISLIFCANHITNPLSESGQIDWSKVSRIKIMEIMNND